MSSQVDQPGLVLSRWQVFVEIALIFWVFFLQGAWPVPDVNEPHYLGKAIHYWNPDWAAGDFFLQTKEVHKVFDSTFGWLSLWLTPTALAWTGRLIAWWLLAWSWRRLSFAVLPRAGWSVISAAFFAMLMDRCQMAGEWVIGGVEAKVFAYVFVFLALEALARNRWNGVWLLLGVASALHVLAGGWAAVAAGLTWLFLGRGRPRLSSMWPGLLGGFVLMLPGLLPALLLNISADAATIRQANQIYVFERLPHHLDLFQIYPEYILRFLLLVVLFFLLAWRILLKKHPGTSEKNGFGSPICNLHYAICNSPSNSSSSNDAAALALKRLGLFVIGSMAIALAGAALNLLAYFDRELAAAWLRYYWFRLADVAVPLGVAILGCWWIKRSWNYRPVLAGFAGVLVGLAVIVHFGSLVIERCARRGPGRSAAQSPGLARGVYVDGRCPAYSPYGPIYHAAFVADVQMVRLPRRGGHLERFSPERPRNRRMVDENK